MTDQRSPWATPDTEVVVPVAQPATVPATGQQPAMSSSVPSGAGRPMTVTSAVPGRSGFSAPSGSATGGWQAGGGRAVGGGSGTGTVTRLGPPPPPPPDVLVNGPDVPDPIRRNKLIMRYFGIGSITVIVIGLVIVLSMIMTGRGTGPGSLLQGRPEAPSDTRPELAKRCPPPEDSGKPRGQIPPAPPGDRTVDDQAGISYKKFGAPWTPWNQVWADRGELNVSYRVGQHFVTEQNYNGSSDYHATILSGSVPAGVNDGLQLDLKCTGHQVAADVRVSFYPEPNQMESIRDEAATLGGRDSWVNVFRLSFSQPGLKAKSELVLVALIDVGRPDAAILYVSIPDTHRQFDIVVEELLDSVRPT